jgi:O-acetyl-ADP-ribose deacetylase (regulator of RNase III)
LHLGALTNGMAITSAGRLPCKHVFHLYAKPQVKAWKELLGRCFDEAEKMRLRSLAMPPVGTGMLTSFINLPPFLIFHRIVACS